MVRRVTVTLAALLIAGCASSSPTVPPPASAIPAATTAFASQTPAPATSEPTRSPTAPPSATPLQPSPSASVPSGAALPGSATPTSTSFWAAIRAALDGPGGRLSIAVRGEFAAELRYEPTASATVVDGSLQFVCRAGRAYDGQAGFSQLDGRWACGSDALVRGFRTMGQPVDAWSPDLPLDSTVRETYDALDDGSWRWRYRAENPILGEGQIRVSVVIDPTTGRILTASRSDPLGTTTWTPTYGASFPSIAVP
jgi:hypothetical protein